MHPYSTLGPEAFWASAVAQKHMLDIGPLWKPKFRIGRKTSIATFGSCFAQHFSRALTEHGFKWLNAELPPTALPKELWAKFNFGVFSARTGNIYTTSLLLQWVNWALGSAPVPDEVWEQNGRFYDPFRPAIEPDGFATRDEVIWSRQAAVDAFRTCIQTADLFVFTLGLTESWRNRATGHEYPMCPGTVAGAFVPEVHVFHNQNFKQVSANLERAIRLMQRANRSLRVLLTVSPVPLTATKSGRHVLVATTESKSTLRSVAGYVATTYPGVDYFPSYEIISTPPFRGSFFEPNQRSVHPAGVAHVMRSFFRAVGVSERVVPPSLPETAAADPIADDDDAADDLVCEESLLADFGTKTLA